MTDQDNQLKAQLNTSAPSAPETTQEIEDRIRAAGRRLRKREVTAADVEIGKSASPSTRESGDGILAEATPSFGDRVATSSSERPFAATPIQRSGGYPVEHEGSFQADEIRAAIKSKLEYMRAGVRQRIAYLTAERFVETDSDGDVEATVDGLGELVDLQINESVRARPHLLGSKIAEAVAEARRTANTEGRSSRESYLPTDDSYASLFESITALPERVDFITLDRAESPKARNAIASNMETCHAIARVALEITSLRSTKTAGRGAVQVERSEATGALDLKIPRHAVKDLGCERLAEYALRAIKDVEDDAESRRYEALNSVYVEGVRLGSHVGKLARDILAPDRTMRAGHNDGI
ncbi:YbaB/EbfC family nucleoid-associated protein [Spirillospora sp. NPDC048911]|uniref:YbaB/EbfC family nucleoid-associated protein n=1 Tax=Spirillospora sp. NPDC048911 TaxID=3364527 RepID=UPI00371BB973